MIAKAHRGRTSLLRRAALVAVCAAVCAAFGMTATSQAANAQQSAETVQTGPINEPRSATEKPSGPPVSKGARAIGQRDAKCSRTFTVSADALFGTDRWTLNPDASQTLDILGPMIKQAGRHPIRIEAFTDSIAADGQMLSEQRATTVRGWLLNHGFVPEGTPIEGFGKRNPVATNTNPDGSDDPLGRQKNRRVVVLIDTCR